MFTKGFDDYVCEGDTISCTVEGFDITAQIVRDDDYNIDDDDGHNPDPKVTGCNPRQQKKILAARKAWQNDEWFYCGVSLSVSRAGIELAEHAASLWGIECNYPSRRKHPNTHLTEVANELLPEALEAGHKALDTLLENVRVGTGLKSLSQV